MYILVSISVFRFNKCLSDLSVVIYVINTHKSFCLISLVYVSLNSVYTTTIKMKDGYTETHTTDTKKVLH